MNKDFRLALVKDWQRNNVETVIDFTRYDLTATEPEQMTRRWSLMGEINQKQTRAQDQPKPLKELSESGGKLIKRRYPFLFN